MKTLLRIFLVTSLALLSLGNRGCTTTETVILPEGPKSAELGRAKDEQIAALQKQVVDTETQRAANLALASKAASNVKGVIKAHEYLPDTPAKEAIREESKLALDKLPTDDPAETVKALERVVLLITGQRDEALKLYREESEIAKAAKREIAARDEALVTSKLTISERDQVITRLEQEKIVESDKHKKDVEIKLAAKDREFADYKKAEAEKERRWLVNATRLAALGLIVAGAIALAAFKMVGVGSGLAGAGVLVGLISIGIESLTSQPWWPYLCGTVFVLVVLGAIYGIYRLWIKHQLGVKKTQAIQDMIDEAVAKGDTKAVEELKAHLTYRMGDKRSFWGKRQAEEVVALGLINPTGEASLKTPKVDTP